MRKTFVVAWCVALVGSAAAQTVVDGSERRIPESERAMVIRNATKDLLDPVSAQIRWLDYSKNKPAACGQINAKNSFGGYTGFKWFVVYFAQDSLKTIIFPPDHPEINVSIIAFICPESINASK